MTKKIWKKIVAVMAMAVTIWLATPIPEVSIIVGLLSGGAVSGWVPWWILWPSVAAGVLLSWHFNFPRKIIRFVKDGS